MQQNLIQSQAQFSPLFAKAPRGALLQNCACASLGTHYLLTPRHGGGSESEGKQRPTISHATHEESEGAARVSKSRGLVEAHFS